MITLEGLEGEEDRDSGSQDEEESEKDCYGKKEWEKVAEVAMVLQGP